MKIEGGGPAFPSPGYPDTEGYKFDGMSLRDYFAAKALPVVMARVGALVPAGAKHDGLTREDQIQTIAEVSYEIADAMLQKRGA